MHGRGVRIVVILSGQVGARISGLGTVDEGVADANPSLAHAVHAGARNPVSAKS